jgi:Suppressor of fused protein (SUFU)
MEAFLGPTDGGWTKTDDGHLFNFPVLRFSKWPQYPNITVYATLGLSNTVLSITDGKIRHELLFATHARYAEPGYAAVLHVVGAELIRSGIGLLRGETIPPRGPIADGSSLSALYCSVPTFLPDDANVFKHTIPPTVFVWLLPITERELSFVISHGWSQFEDELVKQDPDLFDLMRPGIELSGHL